MLIGSSRRSRRRSSSAARGTPYRCRPSRRRRSCSPSPSFPLFNARVILAGTASFIRESRRRSAGRSIPAAGGTPLRCRGSDRWCRTSVTASRKSRRLTLVLRCSHQQGRVQRPSGRLCVLKKDDREALDRLEALHRLDQLDLQRRHLVDHGAGGIADKGDLAGGDLGTHECICCECRPSAEMPNGAAGPFEPSPGSPPMPLPGMLPLMNPIRAPTIAKVASPSLPPPAADWSTFELGLEADSSDGGVGSRLILCRLKPGLVQGQPGQALDASRFDHAGHGRIELLLRLARPG